MHQSKVATPGILVLLEISSCTAKAPSGPALAPEVSSSRNIFALEDKLTLAINAARVGSFDGDTVTGGLPPFTCMYGADADKLATAIMPTVKHVEPRPGSYIMKRYGPPKDDSVRTEKVLLSL